MESGNSNLNNKKGRLETFKNWPSSAPVTSERLASAGFYYSGSGTTVTCFSCKVPITDWKFGDIAITKHRLYNETCPFLLSLSNVGSEPGGIMSDGVDVMSPHQESFRRDGRGAVNDVRVVNNTENNIVPTSQDGGNAASQHISATNNKTWKSFDLLRYESERRKTFTFWPLSYISTEELAKDGFFFLRVDDKVQCVFCRGIIGEWEEHDVPHEEHMRHFPDCDFVQGGVVGNVPIRSMDNFPSSSFRRGEDTCQRYSTPQLNTTHSQAQSNKELHDLEELGITKHSGPMYKDYATEESRKNTYVNWPKGLQQKPVLLAQAGFFYCDISDHVRCFHCGGGLRNWEPEDEPWIEHAKWYPTCAYIRLIKGENFVKEVHSKHPEVSNISTSPETTPPETPENVMVKEPVYPVRQFSEEDVLHFINEEPAKTVLELGVEPRLVKIAILARLRDTGYPYTTPEALIEGAFSVRDEDDERVSADDTEEHGVHKMDDSVIESDPTSPSHAVACSLDEMQIQSEFASKEDDKLEAMETATEEEKKVSSDDTEYSSSENPDLHEENRKLKEALKEQRLCKICLDNEVGVVFLPCGHLLSCVHCAPSLKDCPLCRKRIKGTVRTFIS